MRVKDPPEISKLGTPEKDFTGRGSLGEHLVGRICHACAGEPQVGTGQTV